MKNADRCWIVFAVAFLHYCIFLTAGYPTRVPAILAGLAMIVFWLISFDGWKRSGKPKCEGDGNETEVFT